MRSRLLSLGFAVAVAEVMHVGESAELPGPITRRSPPSRLQRGHRALEPRLHSRRKTLNCCQLLMSSPLLDVWEAASGSPYYPAVGKNAQFTVGFTLLLFCTLEQAWSYRGALLTTAQHLSSVPSSVSVRTFLVFPPRPCTYTPPDRSFINLPLLGVPASIAFGYVVLSTHR